MSSFRAYPLQAGYAYVRLERQVDLKTLSNCFPERPFDFNVLRAYNIWFNLMTILLICSITLRLSEIVTPKIFKLDTLSGSADWVGGIVAVLFGLRPII